MNLSDLDVLERIRKGDEKAYEGLFREYYTSLCHFSYKIVKDSVVAEEIVQDIFYYLWEKRSTLELSLSVKSYLFKSVYNNSLKHLRHQKIVVDYASRVKVAQENAFDMQENYLERAEIAHIIHKTLEEVAPRTREIFQLNRHQGLKYQEIADKLEISVKTVEAHMTGILKTFRENLKDYLMVLWLVLWYKFL